MSDTTLIIGQSGTGKSSAIRTLDPKSTFIISVLDKPLPFKGYKKHYTPIKGWDDTENNYFASDDYARIIKCIQMVNKERPEIETLVIDDFQYLMAHEFMRRSNEKGYEKYVELANHTWLVINTLLNTRPSLTCFVLSHSENDGTGLFKFKTIGKMLDDKITVEGQFTVVLHSLIIDGAYKLLTQHDGEHIAKSPMDLFEDKFIDNDLAYVKEKLKEYYE